MDWNGQFFGFFSTNGGLILLWLVGFAIVGGLPAAWLAYQRGRSPATWLVTGTLIGPLAILLVGLAPIRADGPYRPCGRCHEPVRNGALRCPHCGSDQ